MYAREHRVAAKAISIFIHYIFLYDIQYEREEGTGM